MTDALNFVFTTIARSVNWLNSWSFLGVSFLVWLIALAFVGIIIDFIFG